VKAHDPAKWNPPAVVDRLVNENIKLAYFWAAKMAWRWGDGESLSIAQEGLLKAARTYGIKKGSELTFGTWASVCIRFRFNSYRAKAERERRGHGVAHVPLDGELFGSKMSVSEVVADENAPHPCEAACLSDSAAKVEQLLAMLTPRNKTIMQMRYGLGGFSPCSLEEIAVKFSLTRERVRQVEVESLRKWWRKRQYFGLVIREERELSA